MLGSYNTLIGRGASLPASVSSNAFVLGSAATTVYMGGAQSGQSGIAVSGAGLTFYGAASIAVGAAPAVGQRGQTLMSGGAGAAPYWSPAPVTLTSSYTVVSPVASLYIVANNTVTPITVSLPTGFPNAQIDVKNMSEYTCTLSGQIVALNATSSSTSALVPSGASSQLASDGPLWYVVS